MPRSSIFVDLDETLVFSRARINDFSISFLYEGRECPTLARPSAAGFLEDLRKDYDLYIMTSGVLGFQIEVLRATNLLDYFKDIYGYLNDYRTEVKLPPPIGKWLLVDNLAAHDRDLEDKRIWLDRRWPTGFKDNEHVKAEGFYGYEDDTSSLMKLLPEIRSKLDGKI